MLTFIGKGYTPLFVERMRAIVERIASGAIISVIGGIDDICAALHGAEGPVCESGKHCVEASAAGRDQVALAAVGAACGLPLEVGSTLRLDQACLTRLRQLFADGTLRSACAGCEWHGLCTDIAGDGFKDAKLARIAESVDG